MADDTGMSGITVNDLKISSVKGYGEQEVKKPMGNGARVLVEFTGADAAKLMKILPASKYDGDENYKKNTRMLEVAGKSHGSVTIICQGGDTDYSDGLKVKQLYPEGPQCSIAVENTSNLDENAPKFFEFNPVCEQN